MTRILAIYPAAVAVLLLALPFIAPRSGPLTLTNIFSVHLALLALLLLPVALRRRDPVLRAGLRSTRDRRGRSVRRRVGVRTTVG